MKIENDTFIINFAESDFEFANTVASVLDLHKKRIMDFFGIKSVPQKIVIKIYNNLQEYIDYINPWIKKQADEIREQGGEPSVESYQSWMIGDTFDDNINMLNLDLCKQSPAHCDDSLEDILKMPVHELVHICHKTFANGCVESWLMEGIATQLAGQNWYKIDKIDCSAEDLQTNFKGIKNCYHYACSLMGDLLETKPHDEVLSILKGTTSVDLQELIDNFNNKSLKQEQSCDK